MKSDLRATFFGAKVACETVHVLSQDYEVRGLTLGARGRLQNASLTPEGVLDYEKYFASTLIEAVYDPETGEHVFSEADRDTINAAPVEVAEQFSKAVQRLSGIGESAEALVGKSVATVSAGSASDSPSA